MLLPLLAGVMLYGFTWSNPYGFNEPVVYQYQPPDTLNPKEFKFKTRVDLFFHRLFQNNMPIDTNFFSNVPPPKAPASISLEPSVINVVKPADTATFFYKRYKRRKNETKRKKRRILLEGVTAELFKKELTLADSIVLRAPRYQSHKINLDYYLNNYIEVSEYKSEIEWAEIQRIEPSPFEQNDVKINMNKFVYGFHPFWMGNSFFDYNFQIYDRIAYYGYTIDPETGHDFSTQLDFNAHSWSNTTLHKKARSLGCKVDLCIASYDIENNIKIFDTTKAANEVRQTLSKNILSLVKNRGDGVCFDIQKVPSSFKGNYIDLVKTISNALNDSVIVDTNKIIQRPFEITVLLPRFDIGVPYEFTESDYEILNKYVDRWIFTGESSYGVDLKVSEYMDSSIDKLWSYEEIDLELNKYPVDLLDNLLLEVPMYYPRLGVLGQDTLMQIIQLRNMQQVYPDFLKGFQSSLMQKLTYANAKNLDGVAVWALGYDLQTEINRVLIDYGTNKDLDIDPNIKEFMLNLISENQLQKDSLLSIEGLKVPELSSVELPRSNLISLINKKSKESSMIQHVIVMCLVILLFFVFLGFIIALFYESAREFIFSRNYILNTLSVVFILSVLLLLKRLDIIAPLGFVFSTGILFGVSVSIIMYKNKKEKKYEETP